MKKLAVDTNVLVRILADNGSVQAGQARMLLTEGLVVVGLTVLLETEWVLRSRFRLSRDETNGLLDGLLGLDMVEIEDRTLVERSLEAHRLGFDFADALHLAVASGCDEFVTFDREFARRAETLGSDLSVRLL